MRRNLIYFLAVILTLSFSYCGKDGSIGPEGPRGERGERGGKGDKGAKGDDGTSILSGTGAPSSSLGKVGDFYLDLSSSNLYGPKISSGWGSPTSIQGDKGDKGATGAKGDKGATGAKGDKGDKGATGAKGQDGSQFLSGAAAPPASLGKVGDFYFRTSTSLLYGPKTASGWGTGTSLKGAKGDKGEKGDKGDPGNANVHVYTKDIRNLTWSTVGSTAKGYLRLEISAPNVLTRDVIENWTILTYVKATDYSGDWALLPYYTDRNIRVQSQFHEGRLILKRDQDGKPATQSSFSFVKVVLIEPSQTNILSRAVDFNDYHAVAKHFNLEN